MGQRLPHGHKVTNGANGGPFRPLSAHLTNGHVWPKADTGTAILPGPLCASSHWPSVLDMETVPALVNCHVAMSMPAARASANTAMSAFRRKPTCAQRAAETSGLSKLKVCRPNFLKRVRLPSQASDALLERRQNQAGRAAASHSVLQDNDIFNAPHVGFAELKIGGKPVEERRIFLRQVAIGKHNVEGLGEQGKP